MLPYIHKALLLEPEWPININKTLLKHCYYNWNTVQETFLPNKTYMYEFQGSDFVSGSWKLESLERE